MSYLRYLCLLANSGVPTCSYGVRYLCLLAYSGVSYLQHVMCYLRYLCLLAYSGVQHVLFTLFVFVSV